MIATIIMIVITIVLLALTLWMLIWRRRPRDLKPELFTNQWQELQQHLKDKKQWPEAIIAADKLLDKALKKKRVGGKNMGERLVKAQRLLTDNDGVWFGHKLRGQIEHDPAKRLKESDVKDALIGIRQALKDLGALPETAGKKSPVLAVPTPKTAPKPPARKPPAKAAVSPKSTRTNKPPARAVRAAPANPGSRRAVAGSGRAVASRRNVR